MITTEMLKALWCPICREGSLVGTFETESNFTTGELKCEACDATYPVREGIPDLIPHVRLEAGEWDTWQKHLDRFYERRASRAGGRPTPSQSGRWDAKAQAFADFIDLPDGLTIDVGCGPGKLRFPLQAPEGTYFGVDPLPVPDVDSFPYARALAEYIPFKDGTFSAMIVRSALDHFCELDTFFTEAIRVLKPDGRLYIEQVVMRRGPVALAKTLAHSVNDFVDDIKTRSEDNTAPKHMNEFSDSRLMETARRYFTVRDVHSYDRNWYTPTQMFVALGK